MFWLTAIVRPFKLDDLYERLLSESVGGMTVTEVNGFGNQHAESEVYRGNSYTSRFIPKIKIEVAISGRDLDRVIQCIVESCKTGSPGDGKIFVNSLEHVIRIRNGEIDLEAI